LRGNGQNELVARALVGPTQSGWAAGVEGLAPAYLRFPAVANHNVHLLLVLPIYRFLDLLLGTSGECRRRLCGKAGAADNLGPDVIPSQGAPLRCGPFYQPASRSPTGASLCRPSHPNRKRTRECREAILAAIWAKDVLARELAHERRWLIGRRQPTRGWTSARREHSTSSSSPRRRQSRAFFFSRADWKSSGCQTG